MKEGSNDTDHNDNGNPIASNEYDTRADIFPSTSSDVLTQQENILASNMPIPTPVTIIQLQARASDQMPAQTRGLISGMTKRRSIAECTTRSDMVSPRPHEVSPTKKAKTGVGINQTGAHVTISDPLVTRKQSGISMDDECRKKTRIEELKLAVNKFAMKRDAKILEWRHRSRGSFVDAD